MLSVLLESPRALATVIVILLLLDYRIRAVLLRCQVRQSFVEQDVLPRPALGEPGAQQPGLLGDRRQHRPLEAFAVCGELDERGDGEVVHRGRDRE